MATYSAHRQLASLRHLQSLDWRLVLLPFLLIGCLAAEIGNLRIASEYDHDQAVHRAELP
jgi:hypothetical protein